MSNFDVISFPTETAEGKVAGSVGPYGAVLCDGSEYTGTYVDDMSEQVSVPCSCMH